MENLGMPHENCPAGKCQGDQEYGSKSPTKASKSSDEMKKHSKSMPKKMDKT